MTVRVPERNANGLARRRGDAVAKRLVEMFGDARVHQPRRRRGVAPVHHRGDTRTRGDTNRRAGREKRVERRAKERRRNVARDGVAPIGEEPRQVRAFGIQSRRRRDDTKRRLVRLRVRDTDRHRRGQCAHHERARRAGASKGVHRAGRFAEQRGGGGDAGATRLRRRRRPAPPAAERVHDRPHPGKRRRMMGAEGAEGAEGGW